MGKDTFSQSELLKHLANNDAKCEDCGKTALDIKLDLHHKDHDKTHDTYKNIEILCDNCHAKREGRDKKLSELR